MLTLEGCRARQQRLLGGLKGGAVLSHYKTICYFTGAVVDPSWPHALVVTPNADWVLITNTPPNREIAAEVRTYTGYTLERPFGRETGHSEMKSIARELVHGGVLGVEEAYVSGGMVAALGLATHNLTPAIIEMRRRKDPDEIECMRATTRLTEAGYGAIKKRLEAGMTEWQAYSIVENAIVEAAGTSVDVKGDFACGTRAIGAGGPPTERRVQKGDLYIFDLFPSYNGYMCDLCRTFAIGPPSAAQQDVWAHVLEGHDVAQRLIRPGNRTRDVYIAIREHLGKHPGTERSFTHHAGHGVGMEGWEQPWLNRGSDQTFLEGEVIACEPGLYSAALNGGVRLEHNYLVTAHGPVPLDTFPMEL